MSKSQSEVQLKITALIDGLVDVAKLVTEVDKLGGQTAESSEEVERLVSTLDNLRQQDQLISEFQTLKKGTADLSSTLDEARTRATSLGKGLADSKQQVASTNAEYRSSKATTGSAAARPPGRNLRLCRRGSEGAAGTSSPRLNLPVSSPWQSGA